jgi:nucleoid DNA-binding protein
MTRARNVQAKVRFDAKALTRSQAEGVVERFAKETHLSKTSAAAALDAIVDSVGKSLKNVDEVRLVGFGTFSVRKHVASDIRYLDSSKEIDVPVRAAGGKGGQVSLIGFGTFPVRQDAVENRGDSDKNEVPSSAFEPDARARALLRGLEIAQEDLRKAGGAYDLEEVRALMSGISRQRVDRRVKEGSLLAVPGPSNRRRYPAIQFARDGKVVEGLKEVQQALSTKNPWSVLSFLINPDELLGGRKPIDALKIGEIEVVVEAARRMGQQGA